MDCDCCPVQGKAWPPCCPSALATRNTGPCAGWPASPGGAQADGRGTVGQGAGRSMHDEPAATYCQYSASMVLFLQGLRPPACSSCRACAHHRSQASASALSAVVLCLVCLRLPYHVWGRSLLPCSANIYQSGLMDNNDKPCISQHSMNLADSCIYVRGVSVVDSPCSLAACCPFNCPFN